MVASEADSRQRGKLIRLGVVNNLSAAVTLVTGLVMVPFMLAGLGQHEYGTWIVTIAVAGMVMSIDLGLAMIVTREVARVGGQEVAESSHVARSAGGALLLVGAAGWLAMTVVGLGIGLHSAPAAEDGSARPVVFLLVGLALFMDQVVQYCLAVLAGRLRFGTANLVSSGGVILRATLVLIALALRPDLVGVSVAYAAGATVAAALAAAAVQRVDPGHSLWRLAVDLPALRPQLQFGVASLAATAAGALLWQAHPLMIGALLGPAAVVAFYVGMRLPMLVSETNWRTAEVLFPAVSSGGAGRDTVAGAAVALSTGVRWLTLIVLPAAVLSMVLAPSVLGAWLAEVPPGSDSVLRLGALVVLLDAWSVAAMQVLWGLGSTARIAGTMSAAAGLAIGLNFVLLPMLGALAAPLALLAGLVVVALSLLSAAATATHLTLRELFARDVLRLLPAGVACAAGAWFGARLAGGGDLAQVVIGCLLGATAYLTVVRYSPAVAEERAILKQALAGNAERWQRAVRERVKRIGPLRSAWYLGIVLRRRLAYRSSATSAALDQLFDDTPDPWRYDSPGERGRHAVAEGFVARIEGAAGLGRVLEIGCAEGTFTERLAPRCGSLLSLDVSAAALERARGRRDWGDSVRFDRFDLLRGSLPGRFTAVVVMDVLTYFESVAQLHAIREKIVDALEPGGWLLVGDVRQSDVYESSWWGRKLLCGGLNICEFMAAHGRLELVASTETETHVFRLLRMKP